jgi:hypothetical protein
MTVDHFGHTSHDPGAALSFHTIPARSNAHDHR